MLTRRAPLERKTWPGRRPPRRITRQAQEPEYRAWVRAKPCVCRELDPAGCGGRIEADHGDDHGTSQRNPDACCLPVCERHHRHVPFRTREPWLSWEMWQRGEWLRGLREKMRAAWAALQEAPRG